MDTFRSWMDEYVLGTRDFDEFLVKLKEHDYL